MRLFYNMIKEKRITMKFETILKILFELLSNKTITAKSLSEEYGISVRTVYRYIDCLDAAGVPLYTTRGNHGGIHITDTFRLSSTFLTVSEYEQVINSLSAIVKSVPNKTLKSALDKLKSTVKNEYSRFDVKSGNLIIDAGPWGDTEGYKSKLLVLNKSIENCSPLFIKYHDRNGVVSERIIEPHLMVFKQGLWYTYAYCRLRKGFRFFKTGRIESATILNGQFIRQDISKMKLPLDFWQDSVIAETVEMEVKKSVLSDVEEWLGIENVKTENGKNIARAKLPFDNGLVSKIISYGDGVKILSPDTLKEKVKLTAEKIAAIYR